MPTSVTLIAGLWLMAWSPSGGVPQFGSAGIAGPSGLHAAAGPARENPAALLDLTDEELKQRVESDLPSLGSLSIGTPSGAILINAVNLSEGPGLAIAPSADTWGTSETIAGIQTAVNKVHELFPDAQSIVVGDLSYADGGRMKRHGSHQAGRDADLGFYYAGGQRKWFEVGTAANLDLPKNWALVRALVTCTDVEAIFLDTRIQKLLYKYALSISEDKDWLDRIFQFSRGSRNAIISHVPLHRTHYHVRFYNPVAQELGRRAFPYLVEAKIVRPPVSTVRHVVQPGQTLGHLAARYGTSIRAIQQANGLTTTQLRAGRAYRIPVRAAAPPIAPIVVPLRMLPTQTPAAMAAAEWPTMLSLYGDRLGALMEFPILWPAAFPRF
ncbi:MAG: penicillin-insensitive murein endopeptidase [Acidobacteria bacterium]|nr:penicillin-insensitive murein endopeptidase [Acidobacteriota bacterium]